IASNKNMGDALDKDTGVTVTVKCPTCATTYPVNQVSVSIQRTESMIFAKILNVTGIADKVTAVAETSINANGMSCIKPWFIPNTIGDNIRQPCDAAAAGNMFIQNNQITQFGKNNFGV